MTAKTARKKTASLKKGQRLVSAREFWTPERIADMNRHFGPRPAGLTPPKRASADAR